MRSCYDCHAGARAEFARKNVHKPVAKDDCSACHLSHGFSQKLVLKLPPEQLCVSCHPLAAAAAGAHRHPAYERGDCLACHDPHASDRPHLVRDGTPEASCFVCHTRSRDESKLAHVHGPFKSGDCSSCHVAHEGTISGLLKANGDALCAGCHAAGEMQAKHANVGRGGLECLDCHAPHASDADKLMRGTSHEPVAKGRCEDCHVMSAGKPTAQLLMPAQQLCLKCHPQVAGAESRAHPHDPMRKGDCLSCHDAHRGTSAGALLKSKPMELCGS